MPIVGAGHVGRGAPPPNGHPSRPGNPPPRIPTRNQARSNGEVDQTPGPAAASTKSGSPLKIPHRRSRGPAQGRFADRGHRCGFSLESSDSHGSFGPRSDPNDCREAAAAPNSASPTTSSHPTDGGQRAARHGLNRPRNRTANAKERPNEGREGFRMPRTKPTRTNEPTRTYSRVNGMRMGRLPEDSNMRR